MTDEFFWDYVKVPKATGTDKDAARENVEETPETAALHQVLFEPHCAYTRHSAEDESKDDDPNPELNNDGDDLSMNTFNIGNRDEVTGVEGENGPGNVEGWENLGDDDAGGADAVNDAMKKGRMKRKPMNKLMLKDPLGLDGDLAMKDEGKRHEKKKLEKKRPFVMIKVACRHYNSSMSKKCKYLHDDIIKSKNGTYDKMDYSWMSEYDEEMMDVGNNA
jgi:hypothetical protein